MSTLICKQGVAGSNPTISTKKGHRLSSVTFFVQIPESYPPRFALPPRGPDEGLRPLKHPGSAFGLLFHVHLSKVNFLSLSTLI